MIKFLIGPALVGALAIVILPAGCSSSGGFSCEGKSKCTNDPPPSDAAIKACNDALKGPCGEKFKKQGECFASAACTVEMKTDVSKCTKETSDWLLCLQTSGDGGGGLDGGGSDSGGGGDSGGMDSGGGDGGNCIPLNQSCEVSAHCCSKYCYMGKCNPG